MAQPVDARLQLEAVRLTALYGRRAVVKDVSLLFPAHTVTAVIGPSGCGKSTFLRCLNRMRSEEHTSELQSRLNLVCRLLLEKKKTQTAHRAHHRSPSPPPPCHCPLPHT